MLSTHQRCNMDLTSKGEFVANGGDWQRIWGSDFKVRHEAVLQTPLTAGDYCSESVCLSVLWFSQQLFIQMTSHVVSVLLRTRGSAESSASSWNRSAAALHPPDVHITSAGLSVCWWSRWMCSETAAPRSFTIFPPDKTQTLTPQHPPPSGDAAFSPKERTCCVIVQNSSVEKCLHAVQRADEPLMCFTDRLFVPRCSCSQRHQSLINLVSVSEFLHLLVASPHQKSHESPSSPADFSTADTTDRKCGRNDLLFF